MELEFDVKLGIPPHFYFAAQSEMRIEVSKRLRSLVWIIRRNTRVNFDHDLPCRSLRHETLERFDSVFKREFGVYHRLEFP